MSVERCTGWRAPIYDVLHVICGGGEGAPDARRRGVCPLGPTDSTLASMSSTRCRTCKHVTERIYHVFVERGIILSALKMLLFNNSPRRREGPIIRTCTTLVWIILIQGAGTKDRNLSAANCFSPGIGGREIPVRCCSGSPLARGTHSASPHPSPSIDAGYTYTHRPPAISEAVLSFSTNSAGSNFPPSVGGTQRRRTAARCCCARRRPSLLRRTGG